MGWWSDIVDVVEKPFEWVGDAVGFFVDASIDIVSGIGSLFGGLMPDMPSSPTYDKDNPSNTIKEGLEIPRAYGRVKIAGNVLRINSPDEDEYIKMIVGHCEGPIDQILAWYINNKDITTLKDNDGGGNSGGIVSALHSQLLSQSKMYYDYNSGTTTQGLLSVGGTDLFTEKYSAYRGLAYSGLKLLKKSEDLGGSFPSVNIIANTMKCTPIAKNLTSTTYAWTKSGSGTSEYYCRLAASTNPGVSSPQTLYINDISKTTALLGSLTTGTWNYGDNDALGYSTVYVCLTRGDSGYADPDVSPLIYTIKVEEQKTFSRNPAVVMWDWYRHVENYSIDEMDDLSWKSLEVVCNQTPIGEGGPIRPPGPSRETVKETTNYGQTDSDHKHNFYGCYAFDINRSIDGDDAKNCWESKNLPQITFTGSYLDMTGAGRQRLNVDLGVEGILTKIVLVNYHDNGVDLTRGIKTFSLQSSTVAADLLLTDYPETGSSWVSIPQIFNASIYSAATPEVAYSVGSVSIPTYPSRYYSIKMQDNQGHNDYLGLRDCCFWIRSKRYLFDYIYDNAVEINDAKKLIWQAYNGSVIRSQGKLKPVFKWYQEADGTGGVTNKIRRHTFTEANIIKDSFAWSIPERINSVEVEYLDPNENFKKTSLRIRDDDDINARGEVQYKETCYFITAQDVARRRAQQKLNEATYIRKRCMLKGMDDSSSLEIYDLSGVSHILAPWEGVKDFLILSKTENAIGECEFELEEYYPGIYNDQQAPVPESFYTVTGLLKEEPKAVVDLTLTNSSYWDDKGMYNFQGTATYLMPDDDLNIDYIRYQYSLLQAGVTVRTAGSGASYNLSMDTATYASATTNMVILMTTGTTALSRIIVSLDAGSSNQVTVNGEVDAYNGGSGYSFKYLKFVDYPKGTDRSKGNGFIFDGTAAEIESGDTLYVRAIPVNRQGVSANQNNCTSAMCEFKINFNTEIAAINKDCKRFFPAGVYELTSAVTIPDYNITIAGVNRDAVVVQNFPASSALVLYNSTTKQITFQDFTISSQNSVAYSNLITVYSSATQSNSCNLNIKDLKFNCKQDGSAISTNKDNAIYANKNINNIIIQNVEMEKGNLYIEKCNNITVKSNTLNNCQYTPIYCSKVTSILIAENKITNIMFIGIYTSTCYNENIINDNIIACGSATSLYSSPIGIGSINAEILKMRGNNISFVNTSLSTTTEIYGISIANNTDKEKQEIINNTININFETTQNIYGIISSYSDYSNISDNIIRINNLNTSLFHYGLWLPSITYSGINGNKINMVNSSSRDIGIILDTASNNNTLLNNSIQNTGTTTIWNLGANNNIGTNTEPGLNITTQDGGNAKSFMSFS